MLCACATAGADDDEGAAWRETLAITLPGVGSTLEDGQWDHHVRYGVATISRLHKIIGLFCRV